MSNLSGVESLRPPPRRARAAQLGGVVLHVDAAADIGIKTDSIAIGTAEQAKGRHAEVFSGDRSQSAVSTPPIAPTSMPPEESPVLDASMRCSTGARRGVRQHRSTSGAKRRSMQFADAHSRMCFSGSGNAGVGLQPYVVPYLRACDRRPSLSDEIIMNDLYPSTHSWRNVGRRFLR